MTRIPARPGGGLRVSGRLGANWPGTGTLVENGLGVGPPAASGPAGTMTVDANFKLTSSLDHAPAVTVPGPLVAVTVTPGRPRTDSEAPGPSLSLSAGPPPRAHSGWQPSTLTP